MVAFVILPNTTAQTLGDGLVEKFSPTISHVIFPQPEQLRKFLRTFDSGART